PGVRPDAMPPHSFRLEKSSGFCHPASIPTRPSFLGCHNCRQISGVLEGRWRFTESLVRGEESLLWIGNSVSIRSTSFRGILSHLLFFQCYRSDPRWLSNCQFSWRRLVVLLSPQLWPLGFRWMVAICRSQ